MSTPISTSSFDLSSTHSLLQAVGWPRLRMQELGQASWSVSNVEDFSVTTGTILREEGLVRLQLSRVALGEEPESLLQAAFEFASASSDPQWVGVQGCGPNNAFVEPSEAAVLFRHWVDGQPSLPKFFPLGAAPLVEQVAPTGLRRDTHRPVVDSNPESRPHRSGSI